MTCNNCGAENPDGNRFCGNCGKPVSAQQHLQLDDRPSGGSSMPHANQPAGYLFQAVLPPSPTAVTSGRGLFTMRNVVVGGAVVALVFLYFSCDIGAFIALKLFRRLIQSIQTMRMT